MTKSLNVMIYRFYGVLFMGNKPIGTSSDPLVLVQFKILKSQKDFLDNLGDRVASGFIRKLIGAQMSGHEAEISKLKDEARQHEAHLNIIKAQISELEAVDQRKDAASQTREQLLEQAAWRIISGLHSIKFKDRELMQIFKNNLEMINRTLGGNIEPVTSEELKTITIKKAKAKGLNIYE